MTDLWPPPVVEAREQDPWRARQKRYFEVHPKRCVICQAGDAVHAHHRHYRDPRGWEQDRTIVALCAPHHRIVHFQHDYWTLRTHLPDYWSDTKKQEWRRKWKREDVLPYRHLSWVTTFAIFTLKVGLWMRRPWVLVASTVAAVWWVGLWLPVAVLVVIVAARSLRRLKPT